MILVGNTVISAEDLKSLHDTPSLNIAARTLYLTSESHMRLYLLETGGRGLQDLLEGLPRPATDSILLYVKSLALDMHTKSEAILLNASVLTGNNTTAFHATENTLRIITDEKNARSESVKHNLVSQNQPQDSRARGPRDRTAAARKSIGTKKGWGNRWEERLFVSEDRRNDSQDFLKALQTLSNSPGVTLDRARDALETACNQRLAAVSTGKGKGRKVERRLLSRDCIVAHEILQTETRQASYAGVASQSPLIVTLDPPNTQGK